MNPKMLLTMLLSVAFLFGTFGQAHAVPMPYKVNGTFSDGGLLSGSMEIDSDAGPLNYIVPTSWSFMTSGGVDPIGNSISNFTYNPLSSSLLVNFSFLSLIFTDFGTGRSLIFTDYSPLLNQPGPYSIGSITESYNYAYPTRFGTFNLPAKRDGSGTAASLPEPASVLLLGSGFAALGALRYRKDKKA